MDLTETAAVVSRSIVALGSLAVPTRFKFGPNDGIPPIIGTGFVVDPRGVVMTAGHVARALRALPKHPVTGKHAAVAILFTDPERVGDGLEMKPIWIEVKGYSFLETFTTNEGIFYGEKLPDLAFVALAIRDVPALSFCSEPNAIRMGLDVAFAGLPFGSDGLLLRIDDQSPMSSAAHRQVSWQQSHRRGNAVRRPQVHLPLEERPESARASHVRAENLRGVRIHLAYQRGPELERSKSNKAFPL